MNILKKIWQANIPAFIIGGIFVIWAIIVQFNAYIHVDLGFHIETVKRILLGEKIYEDIFEVNPPMIFYLTVPSVYLADFFRESPVNMLNLFNILIALGSIYFSIKILKQTTKYQQDSLFRFFITIALFAIVFLVPFINDEPQFGQKSHIFMMLALPYFFTHLLSDRVRESQPKFMIFLGLIAGIGLCIKPYYFIIPFVIELVRMIKQRDILSWLRRENIAVAVVAILFLISMIIFNPYYFSHVIPHSLVTYSHYANMGFYNWVAWLYLLPPLIFMLPFSKLCNFKLLFFVAILASLLQYSLQFSSWAYILFPAISFTLLLTAIMVSDGLRYFYYEIYVKKLRLKYRYLIPIFGGGVYLLLILPTLISTAMINSYKGEYRNISQYVEAVDQYNNMFFIASTISVQFPSISYSNDGRFNALFQSMYLYDGTTAFRKKHADRPKKWVDGKVLDTEIYVRKNFVDDFIRNNPDAVLVSSKSVKKAGYFGDITVEKDYDYIEFLSQDERFAEKWLGYKYDKTIFSKYKNGAQDSYDIYIRM